MHYQTIPLHVPMKKTILSLLFFLCAFTMATAQTQAEHKAFAQEIIQYLSDSTYHQGVEFIRMNLLQDLMEEQNFSKNQLEEEKIKITLSFKDDFQNFNRIMASLRSEYLRYKANGASFEFYDIQTEPLENRTKMFSNRVRFVMKTDDLQNVVSLYFNSAYVLNLLVLTSPIEDKF